MNDSLGDRIKAYEKAAQPVLTPNTPVVIRVDGKAFHTWTKWCERPFDGMLISAMQEAAVTTAAEMQGFKLAYIQSDECTFVITDTDRFESQGWFGYELNKIVSITASMFTAHFNQHISHPNGLKAFFDCRAFNVPEEDVPNVFVWRQKDWARNSVQMYARAYYSQKELHGKRLMELHDLLYMKGKNWADLDGVLKNGTFVTQYGTFKTQPLDYIDIKELIEG